VAGLQEFVLDLVGDGGDVALAVTGDEKEDVDERKRFRHIQGDEVFATLGCGGVCGDTQHFFGSFR
jgi:hypothetical protein